MSKNIVLCADGTGNMGGYTPSSSVYKIYNEIDVHNDKKQLKFYDNGVGTNKNKYLRAASGALGLGFKTNVRDLYLFLARNYEEGDQVYFFGFSRGAATVRACSGFIAACGLVNGKDMKEDDLQNAVDEALLAYVKIESNPPLAEKCKETNSHGVIQIQFLGVWDTVSSLGFPQKWVITSVGMLVLNVFFKSLDYFSDLFFPHRFYNYELTPNVKYACQALAIDDERTSFWPMVWNEKSHSNPVEQVWFAGMHSNVGGGYPRAGMANVALEWMMIRAKNNGLIFKGTSMQSVYNDANPHGRMFDSRDGFSIYYRYHPRDIEKLCKDTLDGSIKVHESVIERMAYKTANYAPGNLPMNFDAVTNDGAVIKTTSVEYKKEREASIKKINRWVFCRKWLYGIFLESTIAVAAFALIWRNKPLQKGNGIMGFIVDKLDFAIPNILNGAISFAVIQHPVYFWGAFFMLIICWFLRNFFRHRTVMACEELREQILEALTNTQKNQS
ncbi:MAG TPA: DUF2235 domain-containing protein [Candidatus Brocadiaceae bacterium]